MIALALLSSLFVLLIVLSLPELCVSFDSKLENGSKLMQKLRRFGSIENLRKTVYIAKSTNAVDANFLYTHEELRTRETKGKLQAPVKKSVPGSLSWKHRVELLPYIGSAFFGVGISSLVGSYLPLEMAMGAELAFAAYCFSLVKSSLQKPAVLEAMPEYDREWESLWTDVFDSLPDVRQWLAGWFLDSAFDDISREDVDEFFAWGMFCTTLENLDDEQRVTLSMAVQMLEKRCAHKFPDERGGKTKLEHAKHH